MDLYSLLVLLLPILPSLALATSSHEHSDHGDRYLHYYNVKSSVALAHRLMDGDGTSPPQNRSERLPLMILYSHSVLDPIYGSCLHCTLELITKHLANSTPTDIFL